MAYITESTGIAPPQSFWEADRSTVTRRVPDAGPADAALSSLRGAANDFMREWQDEKGVLKGYYADAFSSLEGLEGLQAKYADELQRYKETFLPMQQGLLDMSTRDLARREELAGDFMGYAKPQYEAVSGRAMADVAHQSEIGRQAATRALQGLGVNPASGNFQNQQRQSRIEEAANKVLASNLARQQETARAAALTGQGIQLFDPTQGTAAALAIQEGQNPLLQGQADILTNTAAIRGNLVNSYGQNIVLPAGEAAGALYGAVTGLDYGGNPGGAGAPGRGGTTISYMSGMNPNYDRETADYFAKKAPTPAINYGTRADDGTYGII